VEDFMMGGFDAVPNFADRNTVDDLSGNLTLDPTEIE
jgi:hypothetical protein